MGVWSAKDPVQNATAQSNSAERRDKAVRGARAAYAAGRGKRSIGANGQQAKTKRGW